MNTNSLPTSNHHLAQDVVQDRKPNLSSQFSHYNTYNFQVTKERDLDRYRTAYSDRTNIFDNARTVSPANYFGIRHIKAIDPTVRYSPAGMDMINSTRATGQSFTKPFVKQFPSVL
jgi:hypothetical protein